MTIKELRNVRMSAREWRKMVCELSIWKLMWSFRLNTWNDFMGDLEDLAGCVCDMLEGMLDTLKALGRVLRVILLYAVWPVSKPIMAVYWRQRFRRDELREKRREAIP